MVVDAVEHGEEPDELRDGFRRGTCTEEAKDDFIEQVATFPSTRSPKALVKQPAKEAALKPNKTSVKGSVDKLLASQSTTLTLPLKTAVKKTKHSTTDDSAQIPAERYFEKSPAGKRAPPAKEFKSSATSEPVEGSTGSVEGPVAETVKAKKAPVKKGFVAKAKKNSSCKPDATSSDPAVESDCGPAKKKRRGRVVAPAPTEELAVEPRRSGRRKRA